MKLQGILLFLGTRTITSDCFNILEFRKQFDLYDNSFIETAETMSIVLAEFNYLFCGKLIPSPDSWKLADSYWLLSVN
jgi:hypothetical protein